MENVALEIRYGRVVVRERANLGSVVPTTLQHFHIREAQSGGIGNEMTVVLFDHQ